MKEPKVELNCAVVMPDWFEKLSLEAIGAWAWLIQFNEDEPRTDDPVFMDLCGDRYDAILDELIEARFLKEEVTE